MQTAGLKQPASSGWLALAGFGVNILGIACADCQRPIIMVSNAIRGSGAGAYLGGVLDGCGGGKLAPKSICSGASLVFACGVCCD